MQSIADQGLGAAIRTDQPKNLWMKNHMDDRQREKEIVSANCSTKERD